MSIWLSLLIPLIGAFILLRWYKHTLAWWEVIVPSVACFFFIVIFKFTVEKIQVNDTEYHGALVTEARYYEYWETYVRRTCYRTVKAGKSTVSVPYDCSYCDKNPPRWTVVNSLGQEFSVSEKYYNYLMKLWSSKPQLSYGIKSLSTPKQPQLVTGMKIGSRLHTLPLISLMSQKMT